MDLGFTGIQILGLELTAVEVEAAIGLIKQYPMFGFAEVVEWGVYITEDFVAQATDPIVSLVNIDKYSGTETEVDALTLGTDNTDLYKGDGDDAEQTVIALDADLDNGHVVIAQEKSANRVWVPGDILALKKKGAATGAGGAYIPFVVVKFSGSDPTRTDVWHEKE